MNIFIDVRLCSYNYQGVKTYIEGILPYLLKTDHIFYLAGFRDFLEKYKGYKNIKTIFFEAPINSIKEHILALNIIRKINNIVDVCFFPYPSVPLPFIFKKFVVKFHDINPYRFWYFFNPYMVIAGYLFTNLISLFSKKIVVVSFSSKNDFQRYFLINDKKLKVIYDGISESYKVLDLEEIEKFKKEKKLGDYVLFVGNREWTKNLFRLLEAIKILKRDGINLDVVIIGRKFEKYKKIDQEILLKYKDFVRLLYDIPEEEKIKYYNACKFYIQPSLNEGFGLTVLEAMRCGCVCIVSNIKVFKEIFKDACFYFDPYSVKDIACSIKTVFKNRTLQEEFRKKSLEISKKYAWSITATQLLRTLEKVGSTGG
ncbi:MAG: glycosyltransferase family 1 protein [Endomicrobiia bacterium]